MNTISFLITSVIIILLPGTGVTYTISIGLTKGKRAGIIAALGCTIGIIPHLGASITLSSLIMKMNVVAFLIIQLIGVLYLIYLGINMIRSTSGLKLSEPKVEKTSTIIRSAILINLLNPKLTLFFFSFLPQYAKATNHNYIAECLFYGFLFMFLSLIIFIGYGLLAGFSNMFFMNSPKRISVLEKILGMIFIIFAVQLAYSSI